MSDTWLVALAAVVRRVSELITEDEQLRLSLRQLGHSLLRATETTVRTEQGTARSEESRSSEPASADRPSSEDFRPSRSEKPTNNGAAVKPSSAASPSVAPGLTSTSSALSSHAPPTTTDISTLWRSNPSAPPAERQLADQELTTSGRSHWTVRDEDLPLIEQRCRLKALAARWAASPASIPLSKQDLISRAIALPDCFLWMCQPDSLTATDHALFLQLAGCFEATAAAAALIKSALAPNCPHEELKPVMALLAEAQSALRVAVSKVCDQPDRDQDLTFSWLRIATDERHVFLERHMRIADPAQPQRWQDMLARIEAAAARLQTYQKRSSQDKKLMGKVQHKVSLIRANSQDMESWRILADTVEKIVQGGRPASNVELRDLLLPVFDEVPDLDPLPRNFELVMREIARYVENLPEPDLAATSEPPSPAVQEVAQLLAGRSMVLIGGVRKPAALDALKHSFRLADLIWIETREHQSIANFEDAVAQPAVALVAVAIRWSSHSFGGVKDFCDKHGKPFVRLKTGFNPNQVATAILEQCSRRLKVVG